MDNLIDRELDLRGLKEPAPVLRARRILHDMQAGDVLMVTTTGHDTVDDFHSYCERSGHTLLLALEEHDTCTFLLRKHGDRMLACRPGQPSSESRLTMTPPSSTSSP